MTENTNGVALIGRTLTLLASEGPCNAAELARRFGASRTTVFSVLRALEAAGFVERDARGLVSPGPASGALGLAHFGLGSIAGAVDALLPVLRDETDAHVELAVAQAGCETVLAQRSPAGWAPPETAGAGRAEILTADVNGHRSPAMLRLRLGPHAGASDREAARVSLRAVASALSRSPSNDGCEA